MAQPECPNDQTLRNYLLGDCSDVIYDEIERHVVDCSACEATIAQFDSADDTLIRHLPLAAASDGRGSSQEARWIDVLRRQPPLDGHDAIQAGDLEHVSPPGATHKAAPLPDGLANYELLGVVGRGGMGVVFLARHRQLKRHVAIKVVRPDALSSIDARRRFQREIEILGALNHPGIVMATDAGTVGSGAYLVMELIDGADLGRVVREGGPLTIEAACEAGRQIAEALAAAHGSGAVHRDVKPSNAMVDLTGRVRLLDFGLAHMTRLTHESGETSVGRLLGTLDYMAPEQADGERQVDSRADLYGLGAMLYFLLTGRPPHGSRSGRSMLEHIRALSHDDAPPVSTIRVDIPIELNALISRLLSRDPDCRPRAAAEVALALSRWAGGNLAARVADLESRRSSQDSASADGAAAQQSLADLLGADAQRPPSAASSLAVPDPIWASPARRGRLWRWTALAAFAGVVLAGVTIWLKTSKATFKIESEVGDVTVELLDDRDQVRELRIRKGQNETILEAGKYRVRLAGTHDDLQLDHDVITLGRGDEKVARITRVPTTEQKVVAPVIGEEKTPVALNERLYQGRSELDWRRQFEAEIALLSKLEAAKALLTLAAESPPELQLGRILDVGEEIVRASFDDASLELAFADTSYRPSLARRWPLRQMGPLLSAYNDFHQSQLKDQVPKLPAQCLAQGLCQAVRQGSVPRAAFAVWLLRDAAASRIGFDPAAVQIVLNTLDVPLDRTDRSTICHLVRLHYAGKTSGEERRGILADLQALATQLRDASAGELRNELRDELRQVGFILHGPDWPPDLGETFASIILNEMVEKPNLAKDHFLFNAKDRFLFNMRVMGSHAPYGKEYVAAIRKDLRYFLDAWLPVANEYLEAHRDATADQGVRSVITSLDMVLRLYSEGDDWPVEKTALLLTDFLRPYYSDAPDKTTDQTAGELLPATPATLLTQIVRITGRIPEFIRAGHPKPELVVKRLKKFEIHLNNETDSILYERDLDFFAGLLDDAPYEAIKLCVGKNKLPVNKQIIVRGLLSPATPTDLMYAVSGLTTDADRNNRRTPPTDPLLLLAVLADLTGESEFQDEQIATIYTDALTGKLIQRPLENLLSSPLKARDIALRLLRKMIADSKSDKLTQLIRDLILHAAERGGTP